MSSSYDDSSHTEATGYNKGKETSRRGRLAGKAEGPRLHCMAQYEVMNGAACYAGGRSVGRILEPSETEGTISQDIGSI